MNRPDKEKQHYYCEYCGKKFPDVRQLTSATCPRHPDGSNKGRHKLYEGSEKQEITRFIGIGNNPAVAIKTVKPEGSTPDGKLSCMFGPYAEDEYVLMDPCMIIRICLG